MPEWLQGERAELRSLLHLLQQFSPVQHAMGKDIVAAFISKSRVLVTIVLA